MKRAISPYFHTIIFGISTILGLGMPWSYPQANSSVVNGFSVFESSGIEVVNGFVGMLDDLKEATLNLTSPIEISRQIGKVKRVIAADLEYADPKDRLSLAMLYEMVILGELFKEGNSETSFGAVHAVLPSTANNPLNSTAGADSATQLAGGFSNGANISVVVAAGALLVVAIVFRKQIFRRQGIKLASVLEALDSVEMVSGRPTKAEVRNAFRSYSADITCGSGRAGFFCSTNRG